MHTQRCHLQLARHRGPGMHDEQDITITKLPEPTTVGDTTRMADELRFEFDCVPYETMLF